MYFGLILFYIFSWLKITKSPQQGAATTVWAAVTPELEQNSGIHLSPPHLMSNMIVTAKISVPFQRFHYIAVIVRTANLLKKTWLQKA